MPMRGPAAGVEPLQGQGSHRVSCMARLINSQASWCQMATASAWAPAVHAGQPQRGNAAKTDVTLNPQSASQHLLVYDHWELAALTVQATRTACHVDCTAQVKGVKWDADWLEMPRAAIETAEQDLSPTRTQQAAVSKVLQWHGRLAGATAQASPGGEDACKDARRVRNRFELTDPDLTPCSRAVGGGAGASAATAVAGDSATADGAEAFFAASSLEQAAAVEMHHIMAGACTKSLLSLEQVDCMARGLLLESADSADGTGKDGDEVVSVTAMVRGAVHVSEACFPPFCLTATHK